MNEASPAVSIFERAHRRLMGLVESDPELAKLVPDDAVIKAIKTPGLSYQDVIATVLAGYADRPAFGTRAYEIRESGGRKVRHTLPSFTTVTYGELAHQIEALASAWRNHPQHRVAPGEFVVFIAFTSAEMAALDLACAYAQAIAVPLQANLPPADMRTVLADTNPVALIATIENLELAAGYALKQPSVRSLIVIDADVADDTERERIEAVRRQFQEDGRIAVATFGELTAFGAGQKWTPLQAEGPDALRMLMFTSGSTGTPKGAMIHELLLSNTWIGVPLYRPTIQVVCAPLNHFLGRTQVFSTLAQGGTAYFTLKSDMSSLLEDIRIARPTAMFLFPRIAEIVHQHYQGEVQRRVAGGANPDIADAAVRAEMRHAYLGDRICSAVVAGSPTAPEVQAFMRDCFEIALVDGYSTTEAGSGAIIAMGRVQRDAVLDYKLVEVPELGYYTTDTPYPRGELLLKSRLAIKGYFKRPEATAATFDAEGWLHTGDIMEQRGPDQLAWIGRRNNVIKLSQGEYVAIGPLEAVYLGHPLISQIYLYGNSYRAFLLAVVVPDLAVARAQLGRDPLAEELRTLVLGAFQEVARTSGLKSFEVPRDVLIEVESFTHENGLLSSVRKPLRPKLLERYQSALEAKYQEMDRQQQDELARLRAGEGGLSTVDRVAGAIKANLGLAAVDPASRQSYGDLGGDSLGAVSLSLLLDDLFGTTVPVSVLLDPSGNPGRIARFIENAKAGTKTPTFASVHGDKATVLRATDLTLDAFFDAETLAAAAKAAPPARETRTVLLTGVTGFLGRFLGLEWMEHLAPKGGKVICLVRAANAAEARARIDEAIGDADPAFADHFRSLAAKTLEVIPGDLAAPRLGLDDATFRRLADEVDQIVHPGALVNHVLSYRNLFEPNVVGTAELLRLALTTRLKRFDYVSTFAVPQMHAGFVGAPEDVDVREAAPEMPLSDAYAAGYGASKWASEVLLHEAHAHFHLPVTVYRPDMIMAHARFKGQINVPDMFTRLLFSLAATGLAPDSFYAKNADGSRRARTHYDGTPVDFLAATLRQLGAMPTDGLRTFNTISAHLDDGISLDTITDWVESAGVSIQRIAEHGDWLRRFADKLRHLPDEQRQRSALPILAYIAQPHPARPTSVRNDGFVAAVSRLPGSPAVPHLTETYIHKYLSDLRLLGLL